VNFLPIYLAVYLAMFLAIVKLRQSGALNTAKLRSVQGLAWAESGLIYRFDAAHIRRREQTSGFNG